MGKKSTLPAAAPNSTEAKNETNPVASSATKPFPHTKESLEAAGVEVLPPSGRMYGIPMGMPWRPNVDRDADSSPAPTRDDLDREDTTRKQASPKPLTK